MPSAVPPSKFEKEDVQKLISKIVEKRGFFKKRISESVIHENVIWMPYYRIQYSYEYERSEKGMGETALNAMFCGSVKDERELLTLFRPNYLRCRIMEHSPQPGDIVGPTFYANFQEILTSFLKQLNRTRDELNELRSTWRKNHASMRRRSMILPTLGELKEKERKFSMKAAKLGAMVYTLSMCLNIKGDIDSIKVMGQDIFYYPTLVATLRHEETGTERYLVINLVKSGLVRKCLSFDRGLTKLCNDNSVCREVIARLIASHI